MLLCNVGNEEIVISILLVAKSMRILFSREQSTFLAGHEGLLKFSLRSNFKPKPARKMLYSRLKSILILFATNSIEITILKRF